MKAAWFVTGTDTGIGKTLACCALLHRLRLAGLQAVGMKPVAAGCGADGRNDDVEALAAASSVLVERSLANPYLLREAIAPHIAAAAQGVRIDPGHVRQCLMRLRQAADAVVVEGVGGFLVPLGEHLDAADLARRLDLPVVLVVGMRLGCLNHALLTQEAILARGLGFAGWIANRVDPNMGRFAENLDALRCRLRAPLLGVLPHASAPDPRVLASHLTLPAGA